MIYKVRLEIFEGPLDLLLHLIRENQVNVYDIPIAAITDQYLEYLDFMKVLNIDVAGEYLVMAATLTQIKSRMLLPRSEEEGGDDEDPRQELVDRLLEYRRYREVAENLRDREGVHEGIFRRALTEASVEVPDDPPAEDAFLERVSVFDLLKAFERILGQIGDIGRHEIEVDEMELAERLTFVMKRVRSEGTEFTQMFEGEIRRIELVATFLAILELMRQQQIRVQQSAVHGAIFIYPNRDGTGVR